MRFLSALPVSLLAAAALAQGPQGHAQWIQGRFGNVIQRTNPRTAVEAARRAGVVSSPADVLAFKQAFRAVRNQGRGARPEHLRTDHAVRPALASQPVNDVVAAEHEFNDAWTWSDPIGANASAAGDNGAPYDIDSWRFIATGAEMVTFSVQATGANPIQDSVIVVKTAAGDPIVLADDFGNEAVSLFLPAGAYFVEIGSWIDVGGTGPVYGGTYDLVITRDALTNGSVQGLGASANGTTRVPGQANHDVFLFALAGDSRVNLACNSGSDTVMSIQRGDGAFYFTNDDNSTGSDALADVDLPAGVYYVYVTDFGAAGGLPFSLTFSQTPATFPDVLASSPAPLPANGILGVESLRLFRAVLAAPSRLDVRTNPPSTGVVLSDTWLTLHDSRLNLLVDSDDDDNTTHGSFSRINASVPGGAYWFSVGAGSGAGNCVLGGTVNPFAPAGAARFGRNAMTIGASGAMNSYTFDNLTATTVRFRADDYYFTVIGPDGNLVSTLPTYPDYAQSGDLGAGRAVVVAWDNYDFTGPMNVEVLGALAVENGQLVTHAKEADLLFLYGTFGPPVAPGINFGLGDSGNFCLSLAPGIQTIGIVSTPASGAVSWFAVPPGTFNVSFQSGDLHTFVNWTPPQLGAWRNPLPL